MQTVPDMPSSVSSTPAAAERAETADGGLVGAVVDAVERRGEEIGVVAGDDAAGSRAPALKMVSMIIGWVIHQRMGAGRTALITAGGRWS